MLNYFIEKTKKFIFNHPELLEIAKRILSNKYLANSSIYKGIVMRKAKRIAEKGGENNNSIFIENTLSCNARCIFCAHRNQLMTGIMEMALYKKIIDECRQCGIDNIIFGVYGETLLDPHLFERIKYLRNFRMSYGIITNASLLTPDKVEKLFEMGGLTLVNFSVNGFSREVYEKTMVGLKRNIAYKNILYFLQKKEINKAENLVINISAVKTKFNKKDFKDFFNFWKKQKGINTILPVELFDRMGNEYSGEIGELGPLTNKNNWLAPCRSLWSSLMVYYDGKVTSCCLDNDKRRIVLGNLTRETLNEVLNGKDLMNLRRCHLSGRRKDHSVCGKCYYNSVWIGQ